MSDPLQIRFTVDEPIHERRDGISVVRCPEIDVEGYWGYKCTDGRYEWSFLATPDFLDSERAQGRGLVKIAMRHRPVAQTTPTAL